MPPDTKSNIRDEIYDAIDQLNKQNPDRAQIEKSLETALFGKGSKLDSLGLINLLVAVEQNIESRMNVVITLADDRALSQEVSPFSTVHTLVDYIEDLIYDDRKA